MNELINNLAGMWWAWMWPMLWQVSVLVGLVWVADLIIRRRVWPQVRYALWLLVLVKLVLPPGLTLSTSVTSRLGPLVKETMRSPTFAGDAGSLVKSEGIEPAAVGESPAIEPVAGSDVPPVVEPIVGIEETSKVGAGLSWQAYAMLGWLVGMASLAIWVAVRFWQLRGLHRGADEVALPKRLGGLVQETARKLKLGRVPKVVLSRRVASPAVFGAFRPVLLMPAGEVSQLSRKGLEHVLLHEFAHVKRGDLKVHALWMVLQIVYWFNPLLWFVRRQLQHLRELCCDATVARLLREGTLDYRETILETGRRLLAHPVAPGMGLLGLFEDSSRLLVRLKWLEKKTWKYRGLRMVTVFAVVAFMAACVLPMAATGKNKEAGIGDSVLEGPAFAATLSSGVTVELLGVCEHPSEGKQWWRPDGTVMIEAPYEKAKGEPIANRNEEFDQLREFAVKVSGPDLRNASVLHIVPAAGRKSTRFGVTSGETESVASIACSLPKFLESHEVRVGVASGEWETVASESAGFGSNVTQETDAGSITWGVPSQVKGEAVIDVAHPFVGGAVRIVAEDKRGEVVTPNGSSGGGTSMWGAVRVTFGIPLSQVSRFHIQTRPYQWVTFKNISRGVDTDARVEVEGMIGSKPRVIKTEAAARERIDEKTSRQKIKAKLVVLEEARHRVQRDLEFAERALDEVRERYGISDLEERSYAHPITWRLMRLEEERDDCAVEIAQLEARIKGLDKEPRTTERGENLKKAREDLVVLLGKLEQLQEMREEAAAKKRDLDLARVQYNQRASIRDERKRMLDSLKAEIENLKIMYDDPEAAWPGTEGRRR
ncbi:MAG: M56 family metallopeptidase [Planctomycetota bacterium]|jgi:beta-lactamase regulating signal transducer with metallopeptidase domain